MPSDMREAAYNRRVFAKTFTIDRLMAEHQAMSYVLDALPHIVIRAYDLPGAKDDFPTTVQTEARNMLRRELEALRG